MTTYDDELTDSQLMTALTQNVDQELTDSQLMTALTQNVDQELTDSQLMIALIDDDDNHIKEGRVSEEHHSGEMNKKEITAFSDEIFAAFESEDEDGNPYPKRRRIQPPSPRPSRCFTPSPPPPASWEVPQEQSVPFFSEEDDDDDVDDEEVREHMIGLWDQLLQPTPEFVPLEEAKSPPPVNDPFQALFDEYLQGESQCGGGRKKPTPPPQEQEAAEDYFTIETVQEKNCKKFHTTSKEYKVKAQLRPRIDAKAAVLAALNIIERILEHVKADNQVGTTDQIRLVIDSPDLDYCIQLPFMPSSELTTLRVLRHLEAIV